MTASKACKIDGCAKPSRAKGLCANHYLIQRIAPKVAERRAAHAKINDLTAVDAAYIAGMIDADGMITVNQRGALVMPLVCVTNSHWPLIEWLLVTIGAGCAYETKSEPKRPDQAKERWNKVHRYQITGRKAQSLLAACRPNLKIKHRQADLVIALPQRGRDFGLTANDNQKSEAADILASVRALNRRGVKAA